MLEFGRNVMRPIFGWEDNPSNDLADVRGILDGRDGVEETRTSRWNLRLNSLKYDLEVGKLWIKATDEGKFNITYKTDITESIGRYSSDNFTASDWAEEHDLNYSGRFGWRNTATVEEIETEELDTYLDRFLEYDSEFAESLEPDD